MACPPRRPISRGRRPPGASVPVSWARMATCTSRSRTRERSSGSSPSKDEGGPLQIALRWIAVISLLSAAGPARADYDLVLKKNCLACHQLDKRKYGPNFKEVAARYAEQKNATDDLAKKIRGG